MDNNVNQASWYETTIHPYVQTATKFAGKKWEEWRGCEPDSLDPLSVLYRVILLQYKPVNTKLWFNRYSVTHIEHSDYQLYQGTWRRVWGHSYDQCAFLKEALINAARIYRPCDDEHMAAEFKSAITGLEQLKSTYLASDKKTEAQKETISSAFEHYIDIIKKSLEADSELYKEEKSATCSFVSKKCPFRERQIKALQALHQDAQELKGDQNSSLRRGCVKAMECILTTRDEHWRKAIGDTTGQGSTS